ncbi:FMRFamide receptor [Echinococcus granulosus]|uniref:FMRFamide receptor n=1 Tax=Echinococcus granulosus TaxID=6210 RepID=U6J5H6_ECHGR|nr:FMRFamide receptor [Echinococcus granulosus]EUB60424.1 FMRFamide receptor [Echinococcus granulosus]CDS19276.1 fmrfamide receptor [Echinococcus granulosus]
MSSTVSMPAIQNATNQTLLPAYCRNPYESGILHDLVTHVSLSIAILGIPANILALTVLNYRVKSRSPTHILLTALAIEDILIIIFYSLYYIAAHYYETYNIFWLRHLRYIDTPLFYMVNWIKMIEIYTVIFLSLERYVAIRWPLKATRLCSVGRTKSGLRIIVVLSGIFKLPNLIFDYRILKWNTECQSYRLEPVFSAASWYATFKLLYVQLLDQVCSFVIPLSLLVFLNSGLILRIRRFAKRHIHGQWTGGKTVSSNASVNSNVCYSDASPLNCNTLSYIDQMTVTRNLAFHTSFRLRRNHSVKLLNNQEVDLPQSVETLSRTNISPDGIGTSSVGPEARQRGMNSSNRSILLTLIGVVTIFIICETPTTVCFLFEMVNLIYRLCNVHEDETTSVENSLIFVTSEHLSYYAYPAALVLVLVGCASNFFIYILIGRRFRRNCKQLLVNVTHKLCCWTRRTKEETDSGFIHPLKHLRRSKARRGGLLAPHFRPTSIERDKAVSSNSQKNIDSEAMTTVTAQQTQNAEVLTSTGSLKLKF